MCLYTYENALIKNVVLLFVFFWVNRFFKHNFCINTPRENTEGAWVILDSMNMRYVSDTNWNRNLFRLKRAATVTDKHFVFVFIEWNIRNYFGEIKKIPQTKHRMLTHFCQRMP